MGLLAYTCPANGKTIIGCPDGHVLLCDSTRSLVLLKSQRHANPISCVCLSPDGALGMAWHSEGQVLLFDTVAPKFVKQIAQADFAATHMKFCSTGTPAVAGYHPTQGGVVLEAATGAVLWQAPSPVSIRDISFVDHEPCIVLCSLEGKLSCVHLNTGVVFGTIDVTSTIGEASMAPTPAPGRVANAVQLNPVTGESLEYLDALFGLNNSNMESHEGAVPPMIDQAAPFEPTLQSLSHDAMLRGSVDMGLEGAASPPSPALAHTVPAPPAASPARTAAKQSPRSSISPKLEPPGVGAAPRGVLFQPSSHTAGILDPAALPDPKADAPVAAADGGLPSPSGVVSASPVGAQPVLAAPGPVPSPAAESAGGYSPQAGLHRSTSLQPQRTRSGVQRAASAGPSRLPPASPPLQSPNQQQPREGGVAAGAAQPLGAIHLWPFSVSKGEPLRSTMCPQALHRSGYSAHDFDVRGKRFTATGVGSYDAVDKFSKIPVELKIFHLPALSSVSRLRLQREIWTHSKITHASVQQLLVLWMENDFVFLVLEAGGSSLEHMLKQHGTMSERGAVQDVLVPLLDALSQLHATGIIHRDVCSENICIARGGGQLRLTTLEMAIDSQQEMARSRVGTIDYVAPEVLDCLPRTCSGGEPVPTTPLYDCKVDSWSVGILTYELLYGITPFEGEDNSATLLNIKTRPLTFPASPPVSDVAKMFMQGALLRDPAGRLSAQDMLAHPWVRQYSTASPPLMMPPPASPHHAPLARQPGSTPAPVSPAAPPQPPPVKSPAKPSMPHGALQQGVESMHISGDDFGSHAYE